ncbi:MAG: heme-binding protein [Gammaproteobacteria bacterium]|nr:heme-binding protein [Gammaproteobacteria bacterium]MCP5200089.1 heme-binding protein [Gammaproteobacteria bacterium]
MANKLDLDAARLIVDTMLNEAGSRGIKFAAAVVDAGGDLIHLARMDGASALNARMSHNKAYTAVKWQMDTRVLKTRLFDMSLGDERREITWFCDPHYTPVWGGIVLRADDGSMLGALGQSGGTYQQDEEIGQIAAEAFRKL